jgi:hypothetical protein
MSKGKCLNKELDIKDKEDKLNRISSNDNRDKDNNLNENNKIIISNECKKNECNRKDKVENNIIVAKIKV